MLKKIVQFFQKLFSSPAVKAFEAWLEEVFTAEKALLLSQLKAFAISAVATAQQTGLDSEQKRRMAFQEISVKAQTAGIVAGASAISLALEMALTALKNKNQ